MRQFNRYYRGKRTAPPPPPPSPPPDFALPSGARIEEYDLVDEVGLLALAGGQKLRFGRSACKRFEPVVGAHVTILDVAAHPRGGYRAKLVVLDAGDINYDRLLAERDGGLGIAVRRMGVHEAADTARQQAAVSVLLRDPVPDEPHALHTWARDLGLERHGVSVTTERVLGFEWGPHSVLAYFGRGPFPRDSIDLRHVGDSFQVGQSFVGLGLGMHGLMRTDRAAGTLTDLWAPTGQMRQLSRLVALLLQHGTGVVLHKAGDVAIDAPSFLRMLGDVDEPECIPFAAWLEVAIRVDRMVYSTMGMEVFGLPNVEVPVEPNSRWSRSRGHEAVLYACYRMVRENRELVLGELLRVPTRTIVGAWPLPVVELERERVASEPPSPVDAQEYRVEAVQGTDACLALRPIREVDAIGQWARASQPGSPDPGQIAPNVYQALFDLALVEVYPGHLVHMIPYRGPSVLVHGVEVREPETGAGFLIATNGFGRIPLRPVQAHTELITWIAEPRLDLVAFISTVGCQLHETEQLGSIPQLVAAPENEMDVKAILLADGGTVAMPEGASVRLLLMIPLVPEEHSEVLTHGAALWLQRHPHVASDRNALAARWARHVRIVSTRPPR